MESDLFYQVIGALACFVIILRAEPALNRMTPDTHLSVRLSIWVTLMGAIARAWWIAMGNVPDIITVIMLMGFAALISCERRLQVLTRRTRKSQGSGGAGEQES